MGTSLKILGLLVLAVVIVALLTSLELGPRREAEVAQKVPRLGHHRREVVIVRELRNATRHSDTRVVGVVLPRMHVEHHR